MGKSSHLHLLARGEEGEQRTRSSFPSTPCYPVMAPIGQSHQGNKSTEMIPRKLPSRTQSGLEPGERLGTLSRESGWDDGTSGAHETAEDPRDIWHCQCYWVLGFSCFFISHQREGVIVCAATRNCLDLGGGRRGVCRGWGMQD